MLKYALAETVIYDRLKCPPTAITGELEHVSFGHFFFCLESHLGGIAQVMFASYLLSHLVWLFRSIRPSIFRYLSLTNNRADVNFENFKLLRFLRKNGFKGYNITVARNIYSRN